MSKFGLSAKLDTHKQVVTVKPINNISVNVRSPSDVQRATALDERSSEKEGETSETKTTTLNVDSIADANPYANIYIEPTQENMVALQTRLGEMENRYEASKIIVEMYRDNPVLVNKLLLVDDLQLASLVKLLTSADEVTIDCEDIGEGCTCGVNTYRKVNAIYVIKNGSTLNLKYDFPEITKQLKELGINIKIVW